MGPILETARLLFARFSPAYQHLSFSPPPLRIVRRLIVEKDPVVYQDASVIDYRGLYRVFNVSFQHSCGSRAHRGETHIVAKRTPWRNAHRGETTWPDRYVGIFFSKTSATP